MDELSEKIDVLIRLQAAALTADMESSKDKVLFLHRAGIRPKDIAEILSTSANYVNVTISRERKSGKG